MKFYYLFFLYFFSPLYLIGMDKPEKNTFQETPFSNSDSVELRIELLENEIQRIEKILADLRSNASDSEQEKNILTHQINLKKLQGQKRLFEDLKKKFQDLNAELDGINASLDAQQESIDSLLDAQRDLDERKIEAFLQLSDLCNDISTEHPQQEQPFILQDITFSKNNNLLIDSIECLHKQSLANITGRKSDSNNSIIQLPVATQFKTGGGGRASCAYQSIKNGITLLLALFCETKFQPTLINNLTSEPLIKLLFGHLTSPWRSLVVVHRKKYIIKNFIQNILYYLLVEGNKKTIVKTKEVQGIDGRMRPARPENKEFFRAVNFFSSGQWIVFEPLSTESQLNDAIRLAYMSLVDAVADDIIKNISISADQIAPCEITGDLVMRTFLKIMKDDLIEKNILYFRQARDIATKFNHEPYILPYEDLLNENLIETYFPKIKLLHFIVNQTALEEKLTGSSFNEDVFNSYIASGQISYARQFGNPGEWAERDELISVISYEETKGLLSVLKSIKAPYTIFNVGDGADEHDGSASFKGTLVFKDLEGVIHYEESFDKIRIALAEPDSSFAVFVLFHLPGHWVTLVVNKLGLRKQYIVTDSAGSNRVDAKEIRELIALLEGLQEPELIPDEESDDYVSDNHSASSAATKPKNNQAQSGYCTIS